MPPQRDILDQPERLRGSFLGSLALHASIAAAFVVFTFVESRHPRENWGYLNGGGIGSVAVGVVARIPLPSRSGPVNPVANDTESVVPEPPAAKAKPQPKVKAADLDAIPIPSRNATRRPSEAAAAPNSWRAAQQNAANQIYSSTGQRVVSPMYGMAGGGDVSIGNNSPFGTRFGWYAELVKNKVAQNWRTSDVDSRIRSAKAVIVTFTILRNGSVPERSVQVAESSGLGVLDLSAKRAIMDAAPFAQLPGEFSRNQVDIEFKFELRR
jgi:periplasmic protein TonB